MALWRRAADLKRRAAFLGSQSFIVLAIQVPKNNEKSASSAEQFFAAVHGIYREDPIIQEHISFEIVASKDSIVFYLFCPLHLREFVEGQLYAQYPDLQIRHATDYTQEVDLNGKHVATSRLKLTKEDVYPIKTYAGLEVDPLAGITAVLGNLEMGEQLWLQFVVRPVGDNWQNKGVSYVKAIRAGQMPGAGNSAFKSVGRVGKLLALVAQEVISPGTSGGAPAASEAPKLSAPEEAALKGIEGKITKLGYETLFRMVSIASQENVARARTLALIGAFKQFNTTNLNGFTGGEVKIDDFGSWEQYINREFEEKGSVLNIEELASVYHFPAVTVEANAISRAGSKKGEAPFNIPLKSQTDPSDLTIIGNTDFRNKAETFGIKLDDRKRHIYIIGKSGVGKSTLLENMVIDDIKLGRGVVIVDPHGEFADKVVDSIPANRIEDAIVIDPADTDWPISFNPLEQVGEAFRGLVASGFVGVLKKIFGDSWGPRLEYILRNTTLALLESPNSTMMGIPRMLTDRPYRESVVANVTDPVVRAFWQYEWNGMEPKQQSEAIGPILNKVGQFLSSSMIRNLTCQPASTVNFRKAMDEKKILVVNLSKGKIGEDAMALLGSMIVTRVQLAAMSRADVPPDQRPDCFLYVDEFQNFATDSFATILSEARKYNLGLTIAHQYIAQLSDTVRDAVIGNVGSMILFRLGTPDAEALQREFAPTFEVSDMISLEKGHVYTRLLVDGFSAQPFSARTLMPQTIEGSLRDQVIAFSRAKYAKPRAEVEALIDEVSGYRQKRQAEEASKAAAAILGQPGGGMPGAATPAQQVRPAQPQNQPVQQVQNQQGRQTPQSPRPAAAATQPVQQASVPSNAFAAPAPAQTPQNHQVTKPEEKQGSIPVGTEPANVPMVSEVQSQLPQVYEPAPLPVATVPTEVPMVQPEEGQGTKAKKPSREKPPKVMDGWAYKQVAQRGGLKWYLPETLAEYEARKTAQLEASESPQGPLPDTEQEPNLIVEHHKETGSTPVPVKMEDVRGGQSLQEGGSISL
ncbi:hypothetical protein BH11PAT4_BH11PAT4_2740 [soil metagenome]